MAKTKSVLQLKIQKKIKYLLQDMFVKSDLSFKGSGFFISISDVDISPDLRNLKVFVDISLLDLKIKKEVIKKLNKENVYAVKSLLADKINLRYVPDVTFILDDSSEKVFKISKIIEQAKNEFDNV